MSNENTNASSFLNVPESTSSITRTRGKVERIWVESNTLIKKEHRGFRERPVTCNPKARRHQTYIHVTQMTREDSQSGNLVRSPKPRGPISTCGGEVNPFRAPLNVPYWFPMPPVSYEIGVRLERPESNCCVLGGGEKVARRPRGTWNGIEGESVDWPRVANQLARGWCFLLTKAFETTS